jgi:hypothetical protein
MEKTKETSERVIDCSKVILSALEATIGEVPTRLTLGGGTADVGRGDLGHSRVFAI